ncbi:MAG TPA: hypothetical protein VKZ84_07735 [Bacteriovoracaceae bacterium]|nr:hypothetical protein [Bacteriovoracaceae bacterium]
MKNLIIFGLIFCSSLEASEIDSFTRRYEPLEDSSQIINKRTNEYLNAAIERANGKGKCHKEVLYQEIRKDFNIILNKGNFIQEIVSSDDIPKHVISRSDSIFKYHQITDGYLLARPAADMDGIGIGTTMNFNGHYIGSDKFEHMWGQGYHYFRRFYYKGFTIKRVLYVGLANERLHLGGNPIATGVYTPADLVANFQGMRFWNHLLNEGPDLLGEELGPYISCVDNSWKLIKEVDFRDYIDAGFDEAYNCSMLVTKNGLRGVKRSLSELNQKDPHNLYTCPLDLDEITQVRKKYEVPIGGLTGGTMADYLFNPWLEILEYKLFWWLR